MIIAPRVQANLLDTNLPIVEAGIAVYDATATYTIKDMVQVNGTTNRLYEAIQNVPTGVNPIDDVNQVTGIGTYWFDRGSTNYMRAFDELMSSKSVNADSIYYKFGISDIDSLMLDGLDGAITVRVVLTNNVNSSVVLDKTVDIVSRDVYDWFDWTYQQPEYKKSLFEYFTPIYDATLEVYISGTGNTVQVGHIVYGRSMNYGLSLIDPKPVTSMRGITSKSRDRNGNIVTRRKARYKRMSITCLIDTKSADMIEERLNNIADTPAIFVGDERDGGHRALMIYGELKDHDMPIGVSKTKYKLEVEGYL